MKHTPEALETYANIFEMPRRVDSCLVPASEACIAAAYALRFLAEHIRKEK